MLVRAVIRPRKGSSTTSTFGMVATAPGVTPLGVPQVTCWVRARDTHEDLVIAILSLSAAEARDLAAHLTKNADAAEIAALGLVTP